MTEPVLSAVSARGRQAALEVAEQVGLRCERPLVLRDRSNLLVHLRPLAVVARVATATGAVRAGTAWLAREVAVAGHLARLGAPVVPPSAEVAPGPYLHDGLALTFWDYVEALPGPPDAVEVGRRLRICHEALVDFDGDLPRMAAVAEAERLVERLARTGAVGAADAKVMRRVADAARAGVESDVRPPQAIHGDAHLGNVISTAHGPLWNDWEDTFDGPVAWDLACLRVAARPFGRHDPRLVAAASEAYGAAAPAGDDALTDARRFQIAVWGIVLALGRADGDGEIAAGLAWLRGQDPGPERSASGEREPR